MANTVADFHAVPDADANVNLEKQKLSILKAAAEAIRSERRL